MKQPYSNTPFYLLPSIKIEKTETGFKIDAAWFKKVKTFVVNQKPKLILVNEKLNTEYIRLTNENADLLNKIFELSQENLRLSQKQNEFIKATICEHCGEKFENEASKRSHLGHCKKNKSRHI